MSVRPLAVFRAQAGEQIGGGHLLRSSALASAWREAGGEAVLFVDSLPPALRWMVEAAGPAVEQWTAGSKNSARMLRGIAAEREADWVVLDGYGFRGAFEAEVAAGPRDFSLTVIDDCVRNSPADVLLVPTDPRAGNADKATTNLAGGWKFALLRKLPSRELPPSGQPEVLIVMGGTDAAGLGPEIARILSGHARLRGFSVTWVTRAAEPPAGVNVAAPSGDLLLRMASCSALVCTPSTIALEACAMGIPSVLLQVAENQSAIASSLEAAGVAKVARDIVAIPSALDAVLAPAMQAHCASNAPALIDGKGAERSVRLMMAWRMKWREVAETDAELLLDWANDPVVRDASFHSKAIAYDEHIRWLASRLAEASCWFRIAEDASGRPFAVARIEKATISVSIAASHRGLGLGSRVIASAVQNHAREKGAVTIQAWVKKTNAVSRHAFERAGFAEALEESDRWMLEFQP